MKNKENILKKEIDFNIDLSVSAVPTITFICIFAFAFSVNVLGQFFLNNGENLASFILSLSKPNLILSYLDYDGLITLIGGILIALWNFSFLLNKNHARAVLLLPKKRSRLFNEKVTFPLIALSSIVVVIKIIALAINLKNQSLPDGYITPFIADVLTSLTQLFWGYMCGVAGTILPKRKVEVFIGTISLTLLPNAIANIIDYSATTFLRGYVFYDFYERFYENMEIGSLSPFSVPTNSLICSVVFILISLTGLILTNKYFVKNYKFENCGMVNKNKFITLVSGFSIPIALSGFLTDELFQNFNPNANVIHVATAERNNSYYERLTPEELFILLAVFVGFAIIFSIIFNIISTAKIVNLKEKAKPIIVIIGSVVVISLLSLTGGLGYENKLPDEDDIETITIEAPYDLIENSSEFIGTSDYYDVHLAVLRNSIVFDKNEDFQAILDIHSVILADKNQETTEGIKFTYELKDGSTIERSYRYIGKESAEEILKLWNTKKIKELYKEILLNDGSSDYNEFRYTYWQNIRLNMDGFVYMQSKDAVLTSLTDVLSEAEIKELKEMIYKDITSLAHFEWFKPTESYGLIQFSNNDIENKDLGFVMSGTMVSFQITKEMTNTVEFLKTHKLMKFFETKKEPAKAYIVDATKLGEYYNEFLHEMDSLAYSDSYPMQHRMMFVAETSVSKQFYIKDFEPMIDTSAEWITELTTEEYKEYMQKAHIKYFSGENGTLLIVAFPESNSAQALILS